ncbi:YjbH domain-containing protein [Pseudarcicella hirudinis]|uniref:YjbH domain-containing protein n=1 Tax=Pseudarcicella hirudinis TaxID=1079859 RepID=UPI0035E6EF83
MGLINIPTANPSTDGFFRIGYNYNPRKYGLRRTGRNDEQVFFVNLAISKRLEINVNFLKLISNDKSGIKDGLGDRQIDIRYLIAKESKTFPAIALIMSSPFTIDAALLTHVIVATKHFDLSTDWSLETSLGYGSPYFVYRDVNLENVDIFSGFKWEKKSDYVYNNGYLVGAFGGVNLKYKNIVGLMAEWDSQKANVGCYVKPWKRLTLQGALLNGNQVMFGGSYTVSLLKTPKRIEKLHE